MKYGTKRITLESNHKISCIFLLKKDWHLDIFSDLATDLGEKMDAKNGM